MTLVQKYFPDFTAAQLALFAQLPALYAEWNAKINVVSRQDLDNLEERHVLHSLALLKVLHFKPGARIFDLGTGGGFPGIPLAIVFPETEFFLADGTGKKIHVVQEVAKTLGLQNVTAQQIRAEDVKPAHQFDFVVTRGVASLAQLMQWSSRLLRHKHLHAYPNGLLALKGGNLRPEIKELPGKGDNYTEIFPISQFFQEPFFEEKAVVYVQG